MIRNGQILSPVQKLIIRYAVLKKGGAVVKKKEFTKHRIAQALKKINETMPLRAITVKHIVDFCGINRGTFYYHFYDKQELINWIYHVEITEPTRAALEGEPQGWKRISDFGLQVMYENREFYMQALRLPGQNTLSDYIRREIEGNWALMAERYIAICGPGVPAGYVGFYTSFMASGAHAMLIKWVEGGMKEKPEEMARLLNGIQDAGLRSLAAR